jgi:uncharacterized protein YqeY
VTIKERLDDDLKNAMRAQDAVTRDAVRLIRNQIKNAEIDKQKELDDVAVTDVLTKMVKQYRDSIETYKQGKRQDLVDKEQRELNVVLRYMPQQMSRDEILVVVKQAAAEAGAKGPTDKGKLMGKLMPLVRGKADGSEVNAVATEYLESLAKS